MLVILFPLLSCNLRMAQTLPRQTPDPAPETTVWQTIEQGVERREMVFSAGDRRAHAVLIRVDPAQVLVRVHYSPGEPYSLDEWRAQLPQAILIVNGGFFDHSDLALGLVVADDVPFGESFSGFGGMFEVGGAGIRVRSLVGEPYAGEPLNQAVQGFPMLIETGGVMAPRGDGFDQPSRRTAVGQDRSGRIIFIVVPYSFVSLSEFQDWLVASDLDLNIAVGLDGGRSTGMIVQTPGNSEFYPAADRLPCVIAIYPQR